eukprot:157570-Pyramimonas_sp.AAC.1
MTARLIDQIDLHNTKRNHTCAVHRSIHTRVDTGARIYVQSPKSGPEWGHVARRVTRFRTNLSGAITMRRYRMV